MQGQAYFILLCFPNPRTCISKRRKQVKTSPQMELFYEDRKIHFQSKMLNNHPQQEKMWAEQCLAVCKQRETEKCIPTLTPLYLVHLSLGKKPGTKTMTEVHTWIHIWKPKLEKSSETIHSGSFYFRC